VIDTKVMPEPGDYVAAQAQGLLTFRKYRARGADLFELVPLNEDWPVLRSDTCEIKILGVMAEHRSYRRKR
jgi:SOS-response transcriptional repressor LexA